MKILMAMAVTLAVLVALGACGGGGGGGSSQASQPVPNAAPTVNAGGDQDVFSEELVNLNATASDPDGSISAVSWRQTDGPSVNLSDTSSLSSDFNAPTVQVQTDVVMQVTVTDDDGATAVDTVVINVFPRGRAPSAEAGDDQIVVVGTPVSLDGSGSSDPEGDSLSYEWTIVSAPTLSTAVLSGADTSQASLVPDVAGNYELELTVRDAVNVSSPDTVIVVAGTELVKGVINGDVVVLESESPYVMTDSLQIPYGSSTEIQAGVEIYGNDYEVRVQGEFRANGTATDDIVFRDTHIEPAASGSIAEPFSIELTHVHLLAGSVYRPTGLTIYGRLLLRDSVLEQVEERLYVWYPVADCYIERNLFKESAGISTGSADGINVYVRYNAFVDQIVPRGRLDVFAVENWASYRGSETVVDYNSFLSQDRVALTVSADGALDGGNNYWGTSDSAVIESMIYDANDDINLPDTINYLPVLSAPDPQTPSP